MRKQEPRNEQYENASDDGLARIFINAQDIVSNNKPRKKEALEFIEWVKIEWAKRKKLYLEGKRKLQYPEKGMLATLGYKARLMKGNDRRNLLKFIMTSDSLPFVQGEAYMVSWGDPLSSKRLAKLSYLIANLINKGVNQKGVGSHYHEKITRDNWRLDLEFLYKEYYKNKHTFIWPEIK